MADYKGYNLPLTPEGFRSLRELAGIPQAKIAQKFGVSDRSVRRWDSVESDYHAPDEVAEWVIDTWEWVKTQAQSIADAEPEVIYGYGPIVKQAVSIIESRGGHVHVGFDDVIPSAVAHGETLASTDHNDEGQYCRLIMADGKAPIVRLGPVKYRNNLRTFELTKFMFAPFPGN